MKKFNVYLFKSEEKHLERKDCIGYILDSIKDIDQNHLQSKIFQSLYKLFKENDMIDEYINGGFEEYELNYGMIGNVHVYTGIIQQLPVIVSLINVCNSLGLPLEFHLYSGTHGKYYHYEVNDEVSEF